MTDTGEVTVLGVLQQRLSTLLASPHRGLGPIAADPVSLELLALARRAAVTTATVLITGPSGAGKEVLARYLHDQSPRAAQAFVAINCAALPEHMLEALLFGHERGAFTGAQSASPGLFRAAHGGTLFLDELGELPLSLQAKLLRVVEQREVLPLGATTPIRIDVRLLAATNRTLSAEVEAGRFRADLFWRLSVFPLPLLPLSQRRGDILPLATSFLRQHPAGVSLSEPALCAMVGHDWPGNVRELSNLIERARILAGNAPISDEHLSLRPPAAPDIGLHPQMRAHEADAVQQALAESGGHRRDAARRLGISERALRYKLAAQAGRPRTSARSAQPLAGGHIQ